MQKPNLKLPIGLAQRTVESFVNCLVSETFKELSSFISMKVQDIVASHKVEGDWVVNISEIDFEAVMKEIKEEFMKKCKEMPISFENVKAPENVVSNGQN